jgi:hypothetical protein
MFKTKRFFAAALIASSAALAPLTADAWWGFPFGGWSPWNNGWGGGPWGGPWGGYPGYGYGGYPGYGYGYPGYGYGYGAPYYYGYQPYYAPAAPAATTTEKQ